MALWIVSGIAFLIAGLLELLFCGLAVLGTLLGGVMTVATLAGEMRNEEVVIGPVLLLFYGVWLGVTIVAGPLHIIAGAAILFGNRNRKLLWAATIVSILPLATVYCAPTSLIAGVLGLVTALQQRAADQNPTA